MTKTVMKYAWPAVLATLALVLGSIGLSVLSQVLGMNLLLFTIAVTAVVGGQIMIHKFNLNRILGWSVTVLGGMLMLWLAITSVGWILSHFAQSPVTNTNTVVTQVAPVVTGIPLPTVPDWWWQLPLAFAAVIFGEALVRVAKLMTTGRLMSLSGIAFGLYVAVTHIIPGEIWAWFTTIQFEAIWQQIQSWTLGIWETIVNRDTPWGRIAVVIFIPVVLIGTIWVKPYRWVIGAIALALTVGALGYVVYRDAVPAELKVGVANIATPAQQPTRTYTRPTIEGPSYDGLPVVEEKFRNGAEYVLSSDYWISLQVPSGRCVFTSLPDEVIAVDRKTDEYLVRAISGQLEIRAFAMRPGETIDEHRCG
jgi:hypothetical protein